MAVRQPNGLVGNDQYGPHIWLYMTHIVHTNMTSNTNIANEAVHVLSVC